MGAGARPCTVFWMQDSMPKDVAGLSYFLGVMQTWQWGLMDARCHRVDVDQVQRRGSQGALVGG